MRLLARKKIVLVFVEGPSDDTALGIMLNQIFDKDSVYVYIMHGDITTRRGVETANIVAKLGNEVRRYANSQHYTAKDFKQIIHIVDTDGAFIPEENVLCDEESGKVKYESNGIYTKDIQKIIERNKQKKENLCKLIVTSKIWNIPYKVYYMSCNLDHVLYDKRNSTDYEKEDDAYEFAKKYKQDLDGFIKFICESYFSVTEDYKKSWLHIKEGMNSIERYSNLGICIKEEMDNKDNMMIEQSDNKPS